MWEPRHLTALWVSMGCYRDSFTFFHNAKKINCFLITNISRFMRYPIKIPVYCEIIPKHRNVFCGWRERDCLTFILAVESGAAFIARYRCCWVLRSVCSEARKTFSLYAPIIIIIIIIIHVASVRERTIPTERQTLIGEVSVVIADREVLHGQRGGFLRPHSRFSIPKPLYFLPSSSSAVLMRLSGPRSRPTTSHKIW
jgi:hypothetical protein